MPLETPPRSSFDAYENLIFYRTAVVINGKGPFTFSVVSGLGTVDASTGLFTAGMTAGSVVLRVTDASGLSSDAAITVNGALSFNSHSDYVQNSTTLNLTAVGGVPPYVYSVVSGKGTIDPTTGVFSAPSSVGVTGIQVKDTLGNTDFSILTITNALQINPPNALVAKNMQFSFSATGGVPPYSYEVVAGGVGSVGVSTGQYSAPNGNGTATVRVTDSLGSTSNSSVNITNNLSFSMASLVLAVGNTFDISTMVSGGLPPLTYSVAPSSGSFMDSIYTAPNVPGVYTITVYDSQSPTPNSVTTNVLVNAALSLYPVSATVMANGTKSFSAFGGVPPYVYSVQSGSGSINATSGIYTAANSSGTAVVKVTDNYGNTATANIDVQGVLAISPVTKTLNASESFTFLASGGVPPYTFSLVSGGGYINSSSGLYTAANSAGLSTLRVEDSAGNKKDALITILNPFSISPLTISLIKKGSITFTASGGASPYSFSITSGGGSIDASSGAYIAPDAAGAASVRVTDSLGNVKDAAVTIYDGLTISPFTKTLSVNQTFTFTATGGVTPYTFSLVSGVGSISSSGAYSSSISGSAIVRVTDSGGNTSDATVVVNTGLAISPTSKILAVNNTTSFNATGGIPPYVFSVVTANGGTITSNGDYTAPSVGGSSVVRVTDAANSTADATVTINDLLTISPTDVTLAAGGTQAFISAGGLNPYVYSVISGGGSFTGSTFTAPSVASGASILVKVTDSLGNSAQTTITVPAISVAISVPNSSDVITASNKSSFAVSGTCTESGRTVNLTATGGITGSATCTNNTWSTTLNLTSASDGSVTIVANHSNVNNVAATAASVTLTKDGNNPTISITTPPNNSYVSNSVVVSGACTKSGLIEISTGVGVSAVTSCSNNSYSATLNFTSVADGSVTITATHTDSSGNSASANVTVTKDTIAPVITSFAVTNTSPTASTTYNLTFTASGNPSEFCILENSTTIASCSWSATPLPTTFTVSSTNNAKVLSAWVRDAAGNVSARADSNSVTLDNVVPTISISVPVASAYVNASNVSSYAISGVCNKEGGSVEIKVGATSLGTTTCNTSAWSYPSASFVGIAEGAVSLTAVLTDLAGTSVTSSAVSITKDTVVPGVTAFAVTNTSPTASTSYNLTFTASDSPNQYCILENSTTIGSCSWTNTPLPTSFTVSSTNNAKVLSAWVRDNAGNISTRADSNSVTLDTNVPSAPSAISLSTPATSPGNVTTPIFLVSGVSVGDSVKIYTDSSCLAGNLKGTATVSAGTTVNVTSSTLSAGSYTFYAKTINSAGTSSVCSTASAAYQLDLSNPTVSNLTASGNGPYKAGDSFTISIVFSKSVNVTGAPVLALNTGRTGAQASYTSGSGSNTLVFSYAVVATDNTSDLTYTDTASLTLNSGTIKDSAGNNATLTLPTIGAAGSLSANQQIVIDTTAPTAPTALVDGVYLNSLSASPTITFTSGTDTGGTGIFKHQIQVIRSSDSTVMKAWADFTSGNVVTGLTLADATQYQVQLKAIDNVGNESSIATSDGWTVDVTAPTTPSGLTLGVVPGNLNTSPTLSWSASTDSVSGVSYYQAQIHLTSDNSIVKAYSTLASGGSLSGLSLTDNTQYYFNLRAIDTAGNVGTAVSSPNWTAHLPGKQTFTYTGANQTFTVPAGITSIVVKAWGAKGGSSGYNSGGGGGFVTSTLTVTGGESLTVIVGQAGAGAPNPTTTGASSTYGGGGGVAASPSATGYLNGATGGGRSAIQRGATELLTAGGGGGGGCNGGGAAPGGAGGGTAGTTYVSGGGGGAGTTSAGGAGGTGYAVGTAGTAFQGGVGPGLKDTGTGYYAYNGSGGGGGYYGGGGSGCDGSLHCGGGGGGSNYAPSGTSTSGSGATTANTSDADYVASAPAGKGLVVISW